MDYRYKIGSINKSERWIFLISNVGIDCEDPDSFIYLLKDIRDKINGKIVGTGDIQYEIHGDNIGITYQWDGLFGITLIYPEMISCEKVIEFLTSNGIIEP